MKIFLPQETISAVKKKYIFVDTCLLLDWANFHKKEKSLFSDSLNQLIINDCALVTVEPVIVEFFLGSNKESLKIKKAFLESLKITIIPIRSVEYKIEDLVLEYGEKARGKLSYVDICLGAAIKQFSNKSLVLTRNYKDFPERIFDCSAIFSISLSQEIRTYCFYSYDQNKAIKTIKINDEKIPF